MTRTLLAIAVLTAMAVAASATAQDDPLDFDVWPGGHALDDDASRIGPVRTRPAGIKGQVHLSAGRPYTWLSNITNPTITLYRPDRDQDTGAAVMICPGGGYYNLAIDLEGEEIAEWLNELGITGIILKYRVPRRPGQPVRLPNPNALKDSQRAISLIRSRATDWGIDPQRIGMIGFSAGGHLVAATATNFNERSYPRLDAVDDVSCRPDFGIVCYPGYTKPNDNDELTPTVHPSADAPPLFIVHAGDDSEASVEHSVVLYLAMKRANAPVELHIYEQGEHGFGVRQTDLPISKWTRTCGDWMRFQGFLTPNSTASQAGL